MEIKAYAKINWLLYVKGKRADGYHLLDMLMQRVALHDTLTLDLDSSLTLAIAGNDALAAEENNLVLRAARALQQASDTAQGAKMRLVKRIPTGSGMGGGSADCAAALRGLNKLWQLNLPEETLFDIGLRLGADVPYCLQNVPCRVRGIGEQLTPITAPAIPLVVLLPSEGVSTRDIFRAYRPGGVSIHVDAAQQALQMGDLHALALAAGNDLQLSCLQFRPQIAAAIDVLRQQGAAFAQMTGSGAAVIGAFDTAAQADAAYTVLANRYDVCIRTETLA